ncbi:MAG TPA: hypothetical protein PLB89_11545 [Flavobacteriales bacterium]|nr:hypothetical protein [Flavobacteriales bacterium]
MTTQTLIDTTVATVQRTGPDRLEVRFKPGTTLTVPGIQEVLKARQALGNGVRSRVLFVFTTDETDFDMTRITTHYYAGLPVEQFTLATAWATRNEHNDRFARLYFAYFPSPVPNAIFREEREAVAWLDAQVVQ